MNHIHTCPVCDMVETCDWGYDDDECGLVDEPIVKCDPCKREERREAWTALSPLLGRA